ncbi:MAG: MlaC/ttg2D family ABC transporter substrate-binding protein [Anaplasma sp.]
MCGRFAKVSRILMLCGVLVFLGAFTKRFDTCSHHQEVCGFIETVKARLFSIVSDGVDVEERLEEVVDDVLDLEGIAKFAMGGHWKSADPSQRERFTNTYGRYVKGVYTRQLRMHAFHIMRIMSVKQVRDNTYAVRVRLTKKKQGDDFIVVEFHAVNNGKLGICDMKINNLVSIAVTQRSIVDDVIRKHGVEGAISYFEIESSKAPTNSIGGLSASYGTLPR